MTGLAFCFCGVPTEVQLTGASVEMQGSCSIKIEAQQKRCGEPIGWLMNWLIYSSIWMICNGGWLDDILQINGLVDENRGVEEWQLVDIF